jgi:hypothetical protein
MPQTNTMQLRVTVDASEAVAGLDDLQKSQIPFALAKTLTGCAKAGQAKVQEGLGGKFTLRNNFTRQGIRIKPASKNGAVIEADVHTDTANRSTGAPDYLLPQEDGGEKVPHRGHEYLAVPTRYLRQMAPGAIPAELRPKNLLGAVGGRYAAITRKKGQIALRNQRIVRGFIFFVQDLKDGHKAIMGRYMTDQTAYPFYLLIPSANLKPRLEMQQDVETAARAAFPELWADTWRSIMARGLRITG